MGSIASRVTSERARRMAAGVLAVGGLVLAAVAFPASVRANGVPVPVELSYIDLSNWGPQDATGDAELIFAEGIVRLRAQGLPRLDGQQYQAWLVNSEVGDAISVGLFNASSVGEVSFQGTLPPISDFGFDLLILTVEDSPDDAPQPSERRTIGGYFSLLGQAGVDGAGSASVQAPGQLPNTGSAGLASDMIRVSALAGAMALSVVVGLRLSRRPA